MLSVVESSCRGSKSFLFSNRPVPFTETLAPRQTRQTVDGTVLFGEDEMRMAECHPDRKHSAKGLCRQCYLRHRYSINREHVIAEAVKWVKNNKERRKAYLDSRTEKWPSQSKEKRAEYSKNWREKNPKKQAELLRKYRDSHYEEMLARHRRYNEENKDMLKIKSHEEYMADIPKHRKKRLNKYGLTIEDYENMLISQNYSCAICGGDNKGKNFAVDHDHKTGKVRALLCSTCNSGIGSLKDSIDILEKAIEYLRKHKP